MLGALAVGKTALIQRYVHSIFSDEYLSTVGVKVSKKTLEEPPVNLLLWDLEGQDDYNALNISYIKGAAGLLFVIDGSRAVGGPDAEKHRPGTSGPRHAPYPPD